MLKTKNEDLKITQILRIKRVRPILVSLAFCFTFIFSIFLNSSVNADAPSVVGAAGSADDPLVTLSYINKILVPQIDQIISNKIAAISSSQIQAPEQTQVPTAASATAPPTTTEDNSQNSQYQQQGSNSDYISFISAESLSYGLVELTKNQKIKAKSGTLEMILRPGGTAKVISSYQTQGIADITVGAELLNDEDVPINHSLIVPRADGRGISVTSVIAYILVRGDYEIFE